jgi:hypothetical protein
MPKRKEEETFTVSDRRLFSSEGELRSEAEHEAGNEVESVAAEQQAATSAPTQVVAPEPPPAGDAPPAPSAAEQSAQADAYRETNRSMDEVIGKEMGTAAAADLEVTFERFLGSLYMTSLMQLGLAHEPKGQPRLDLLGARQTIDTLGLLAEKTKGNLTAAEQNFLHNALYELRMAYLEVTNAIARGPQAGAGGTGPLVR